MSQKMSITALENEIRNNVVSNNKFGVLKFVDIGSGTGKLNNGVMQAEKLDKFLQALTESTVFLDNTKMILSDNDKMVLDTMSFDVELEAGRISGTPQVLSKYQNPNFLDRAFDAEELRALTGIHRTALRQNIEQKGFMNTLSERFGGACGRVQVNQGEEIYGRIVTTNPKIITKGVDIIFLVNGVQYERMTDSNGIATLAITLNKGTGIVIHAIVPRNGAGENPRLEQTKQLEVL